MLGKNNSKNSELKDTLATLKPSLIIVASLSAVINFLAIGSSLYLMMVYDRVLPSYSTPTLFGLLAIFSLVFLFHGILDVLRAYMLGDIGRAVTFISAERSDDGNGGPPFFRVRVELEKTALASKLYRELRTGTPAEIFLQTGDRSLLSYLFKPMMDQINHAFRS